MINSMIIGCSGQDGFYLCNLLLKEGHKVYGVHRRNSQNTTKHLPVENSNLVLIEGDVLDAHSMNTTIGRIKPDFLYNLSAQSHVASSFYDPAYTISVNTLGSLNIYESIKSLSPSTRVYGAFTSEMYGSCYSSFDGPLGSCFRTDHFSPPKTDKERASALQLEDSPMKPSSPYGVSKLAAFDLSRIYRESYGLFLSGGLLFNHESPMRGEKFVTRKITKYLANAFLAQTQNRKIAKLRLGDTSTFRDFGYAGDYVKAMKLILEYEKPDDFVIATGKMYNIQTFLEEAFKYSGLNGQLEDYVDYNCPEFIRPCEVPFLRGCADKAKRLLGWKPEVDFYELIRLMVDNDKKGLGL